MTLPPGGDTAAAVLVAAGSGERLGRAEPKALVELGGEALVVHALRALIGVTALRQVVVVGPEDRLERLGGLLAAVSGEADVVLLAGGRTRAASVQRGLAALSGPATVVAVHDAARPLISPGLVDRCIAALVPPWDAVAPALPVVDTLKRAEGERVLQTVARSDLYAVQTPQVFRRAVLESAHAGLDPDDPEATDDLVAVERAGARVRLIPGQRTNLKVTYPEDLVLAEALLGVRAR